jgi:tRNA A-37 threonylcarbamoyl transferase component Bud32
MLSFTSRHVIYDTLVKIHAKGIWHGDVAPRNVVRRSGDRGFAFIDFGNAEEHCCPGGDTCRELIELRRELQKGLMP